MTDADATGKVVIRRVIDDASDVILAFGDFGGFHAAYSDHVRLWSIAPDPLGEVMMKQALAGAALYLSCRPRDETVAWTLNIQKPPTNVFFTGSSDGAAVTGRVFSEGVQTAAESRLFVETSRPRMSALRSVIDVVGLDVLEILEAYSRQSDQSRSRYLELGGDRYFMATSLPGTTGASHWLDGLTPEIATKAIGDFRVLDERTFWFQCGCDFDRMVEVIRGIYKDAIDELFGDDDSVEVGCPRCGRNWRLGRDRFGGEPTSEA